MKEMPLESRQEHIELFGSYEDPTINITLGVSSADFVSKAKAAGVPPFCALLFSIAEASLDIENFRWRILNGDPVQVTALKTGHTVLDKNSNLNFSMIDHTRDFTDFTRRYVKDSAIASDATSLRGTELDGRDYLFVTCTPWFQFTSFDHPIARYHDASIPNIAVGQFQFDDGGVNFPLAVQAHHGLVDGLHIHHFVKRMKDILADLF